MTTPETLNPEDLRVFTMPDGRTLSLYVHHCDSCTSLDVWTTRGNEVEELSKDTADKTRAPMGVMAWVNGSRPKLATEPSEGSHGWPAASALTLVWHDDKEA